VADRDVVLLATERFKPEHDEQEIPRIKMVAAGRQPQNIGHDGSVFSGGRIVVIAIQQHLIYGVADLALGSFHQSMRRSLGGKSTP